MSAVRLLPHALWERLVWHYLAVDGSPNPNHSTAGGTVQVDHRTARKAWESGYPKLGRPPIKDLRAQIIAGIVPHPARPAGAPPPKSKLFSFLKSKGLVSHVDQSPAGAPPPMARPMVPKAPTPPPAAAPSPPDPSAEDEVDWGDSPLDPHATAAIGAVAFPDEEPAPLPPDPVRPKYKKGPFKESKADRLDERSEGFIDAAKEVADLITRENVQQPAPGEVSPDLPSDIAANEGFPLPPIDRALAEQLLLESRTDMLDLAARNKRAGAMATWISQQMMAAGVVLARRLQAEVVKLASSEDEKFDVDEGLRLLERLMKMGRANAGIVSSSFVAERHALAELAIHLRTADSTAGSGPTGTRNDRELLEHVRHSKERLARVEAKLAKAEEAPPDTPPGDPTPGTAPSAPSLADVLTRAALEAIADATAWIGGQGYLDEGRVTEMQRTDTDVSARVVGTAPEPYETQLAVTEDRQLAHRCTCPQGQHRPDRGCKHVVAVGLTWLAAQPPTQPVQDTQGEAVGDTGDDASDPSGSRDAPCAPVLEADPAAEQGGADEQELADDDGILGDGGE